MKDIEYMLKRDAKEKKSIGRGARARVNGSKTKYCGLPSDHLTAAQWKRRNSMVYTYNLNAPMSYDQFKKLPDDLKREYITRLQKLYAVPQKAVCEMMGTSPQSVSRWYTLLGIPHGYYGYPAPDSLWWKFIAGEDMSAYKASDISDVASSDEGCVTTPDDLESHTESSSCVAEAPAAQVYPSSAQLTFTCTKEELIAYIQSSVPSGDVAFTLGYHVLTSALD